MSRYAIKINRFDGGLNTKVSPLAGELNESPNLLNVQFDDLGAVETRLGNDTYDTIGSGSVNLHSYKNDSKSELLAVCSGTMYRADVASSASFAVISGGTSILTADVNIFALNAQNYAFISNGYKSYKYNGTNVTQWGVSATTKVAGYRINSAGGIDPLSFSSGSFKLTLVDSLGTESYPSTALTVTPWASMVGGDTLIFDVTPVPQSAGASYINVYRYNHDLDNDYRLSTTIAGTATNFVDDFQALSSEALSVIVDPLPPPFTVFCYHLGIMFGANEHSNPTYLYYSEINSPSQFDPENIIRVGDGDGYPIRGILSIGTNMIVAKDDGKGNGSVWILYTPDAEPINWSIQRLDMAYGNVSPKSMVRFSQFVMLLNKNGVYDLSEESVGALVSDPISFNIEPDVFLFANDYVKDAVAKTYRNKIYISVPYGETQTVNNYTYVYDFVKGRSEVSKYTGAWSKWTGSYSDIAVHGDELYAATYNGKVVKLETGHDDDGASINSYYYTMAIYGMDEHKENIKIWRNAWVTVSTPGDWNLQIDYSSDFYNEVGNSVLVDLDPGGLYKFNQSGSDWGTATWGTATVRKTVKITFKNMSSKQLMLKFSVNGIGQYFKVWDIMLEYNLRGIR